MKVQKKGFLTRLRFNRRISDMASKKGKDLLEKLVPVLLIASIALAFTVGVLWQRVVNLEGGKANGTAVQVPGADGAGDGERCATLQAKLASKEMRSREGSARSR